MRVSNETGGVSPETVRQAGSKTPRFSASLNLPYQSLTFPKTLLKPFQPNNSEAGGSFKSKLASKPI